MKENSLKYEYQIDFETRYILACWYACILLYQVGAGTLVRAHKRESA